MQEDDSDIKIAGKEKARPVDDSAQTVKELAKEKQNGNVDKANALGGRLARMVMEEDVTPYCEGSASGRIHLHCRLLLTCAAYDAVQALPGSVLPGVAGEAFRQTIQSGYPRFYQQMTETGALSFYMLCLRGEAEKTENMGRTFARLTEREGEQTAEKDGVSLYRSFRKKTEQAVQESGIGRRTPENP